MTLIQCTQSVMKQPDYDFINYIHTSILFQKGYIYVAIENEDGQWMAEDEEGIPHVIADGNPTLIEDPWFNLHFRVL